jgi:hypothetical protein
MVKTLALETSIWKVNIPYNLTYDFWFDLNKNFFMKVLWQVNSNIYFLLREMVKEMFGLMENEFPKKI